VVVRLATGTPYAASPGSFLRITAALDEPRGYCLDVRGHKGSIDEAAPLQAHTCKREIWHDDELFDEKRLAAGSLYMPPFKRCVQADAAKVGASLRLASCGKAELQRWARGKAGEIVLAKDPKLCVTLDDGESRDAGGDDYRKRDVAIAACNRDHKARQVWSFSPR
jgi:hypothetical protein